MHRLKRFFSAVLVLTVLASCLVVSASALSYGTGITTDSLRLRKSAGTDSAILTTVAKGASVEVLEGAVNGWYKVNVNNTVGYMSADYLTVTVNQTSDDAASGLGTGALDTNGSSLNLRSGPGTGYSVLASIPDSATLTLLSLENGWYKTTYNGKTGYVSADYVKLSAPADAPAARNEEAAATSDTSDTSDTQDSSSLGIGTPNTNGSSLNLRSGPGTGYSVLASIPGSATLTLLSLENGWYQTVYSGKTGYVSSEYITPGAQGSDGLGTGVLNTNGTSLNLRSGPGTGYAKLTSIPASAVLTLLSLEDGWYKTTYGGTTGYVSADYITLGAAAAPVDGTLAAQVVDYAKQFLGRPYVYGAAGPNSFDCSGFTSYVFAHFGYSLNRTAAGQTSNGTPIDRSQLQPGDLILWRAYGSSSAATHVGIYVGNNQYIHANSSLGYVSISDLDAPSYVRYYSGARRILN